MSANVQTNVSGSFVWLATRDTSSHLLRRPSGVGNLSTCPLNPAGVHTPQYTAGIRSKHASVTVAPNGEGFIYHHLSSRNAHRPAKSYSAKQFNNQKSGQVERFRKLVKKELGRRDLNTAIFKKASRIMFTQRKARKATPAKN